MLLPLALGQPQLPQMLEAGEGSLQAGLPTPHLRAYPGAHHKDTPGCSTQVARRLGSTGCLVVIGFLPGVEGVIVECQHQVGIHLTEESANLVMQGGSHGYRAGSSATPLEGRDLYLPSTFFPTLTWSH